MKKNNNVLFIDTETRSFVDLKKCGGGVYARHDSTDVICLAYSELYGIVRLWLPGDPVPALFKNHKGFYAAHYALFDYSIATNILVQKYGFPKRMNNYKHWMCTRALSVCAGLPGSLADAGRVITGKKEMKLKTGGGLINKYSRPVKNIKTGEWYFRELKGEDKKLYYEYCMQDVVVSREIYKKTVAMPNVEYERPIFLLDFKHNIDGLPIDVKSLNKIRTTLIEAKRAAEEETQKMGVNVRSGPEMIDFFKAHKIKVDNIQAATIEEIYKTTKNKKVKRICELRRFLGKASIAKYEAAHNRLSPDNTIKLALLYYGAHTGRASGRGFQPLNLPKMNVTEKDVEKAIKDINKDIHNYEQLVENAKIALPGIIKAEKGKGFIMGDFAGIEARGVAYLAGQQNLIDIFLSGEDVYKVMASRIFLKNVSKITKGERQLGKQVILGCGYGMGVNTFIATCAGYGMDISTELAERAVYTYRETYDKIRNFWYALNNAFITAHKTGRPVQVGDYIVVEKINKYIRVRLPSGRYLYYHGIGFDKEKNITYYNYLQKRRVKLWGGIIAENVTQAMCRDILFDRMLLAEKKGLNTILQVYDEVVCYVDRKDIGPLSNIFLKIMNTPPAWLPGFPLETEFEITGRYHK